MKNLFMFLCIIVTLNLFAQDNIIIKSMKGFESNDGFSQLIYETESGNGWGITSPTNLNYYHYDTFRNTDTVIFKATAVFPLYEMVSSYDFYNANPNDYIYSINGTNPELYGKVFRSGINTPVHQDMIVEQVWFDKTNSDICFLNNSGFILISTDRGISWDINNPNFRIELGMRAVQANPYRPNEIYGLTFNSANLCKSIDTGKTCNQVTTSNNFEDFTKFVFLKDSMHIYAICRNKLFLSGENGESGTWDLVKTFDDLVTISVDEKIPGLIYAAAGTKLYKSTSYGAAFTEVKTFDKLIKGIYKKPLMNCIYVAFAHQIIKIENNTESNVLRKSIEDYFNFMPLAVGNRWVYNSCGYYMDYNSIYPIGISYNDVVDLSIIGTETIDNKTYYKYSDNSYIRIDKNTGVVYKKFDHNSNEELWIDLTAENGDNAPVPHGMIKTIFLRDTLINNIKHKIKDYNYYSLSVQNETLIYGIGLDSLYSSWDFGEERRSLRGCLINGVVYGDTTFVGVEKEEVQVNKYTLEQNYPNPFNPSTIIKYSIKNAGLVTLKVFDLLGREVVTLVNEEKPMGEYSVNFNTNKNLSSGVYFYTLQAGQYKETKKMILLR